MASQSMLLALHSNEDPLGMAGSRLDPEGIFCDIRCHKMTEIILRLAPQARGEAAIRETSVC